jgi:sulfofructosephosphate aldolase
MSNISRGVVCIGKATIDAILVADGPMRADSRVAARGGLIAGGGPAATAAVALARQGIAVAFIGRVGDDEAGATVVDGLDREGIDTSLLRVSKGGRTALSAVVVDSRDAGRSIVTHPGELASITVDAEVAAAAARADWIHVDQAGWPVAARLRGMAVRTPISIDGGNPIEGLDLSIVTVYAPSEGGVLAASGKSDVIDAMQWALDEGARLVVVTRGSAGCVAMAAFDLDAPNASAILREPAALAGVRRMATELAPGVPVTSTLGAGDVFHGLLLAALCQGASVREAMRAANMGAAMSCAGLDGRSAIPDRMELAVALASKPQVAPIPRQDSSGPPAWDKGHVHSAFATLARPSGGFAMVAIDQRESLRAMLSPSDPYGVSDADLVEFKHEVTLALAGHASAILFDRSYGMPAIEAVATLAPAPGLILAADLFDQVPGGPIRSVAVDHQAGAVARAVGATALKLLIPWRVDRPASDRAALVREFVEICHEYRMLALVEAVVQDDGSHPPAWLWAEGIMSAAKEMAGYDFDLYKAQVPTLGAGSSQEILDLSSTLTAVIGRPWVVLSSGVPVDQFERAAEAACRGGASGFLAGRAIWTSALAAGNRAAHLADVSLSRLERLAEMVDRDARPWSDATGLSHRV